jgi:hypothetical protein
MSEVLGFGINSCYQYKAEKMPSITNEKWIQVVILASNSKQEKTEN